MCHSWLGFRYELAYRSRVYYTKRESFKLLARSNWNILLAFNSNLNHVEFTHTPLTVSAEKEEFSWLQAEHQGIAWLFCTDTKCSDQQQTRSICFSGEGLSFSDWGYWKCPDMSWCRRQNETFNLTFHFPSISVATVRFSPLTAFSWINNLIVLIYYLKAFKMDHGPSYNCFTAHSHPINRVIITWKICEHESSKCTKITPLYSTDGCQPITVASLFMLPPTLNISTILVDSPKE